MRSPAWPRDGLARFALRGRRPAVGTGLDQVEPWEQEVDEQTARAEVRTGAAALPYRPRREANVPEGAFEALRGAVGAGGLGDLFVVPAQARRGPLDGGRRRQILTPCRVLGFGPGGVALWVAPPAAPGIRVVIDPLQVAAIETVHSLLYAHLTIHTAGSRLTLHYNAAAQHELRPLLDSLRRRVVGGGLELPDVPAPDAGLPYKWRRLLASDEALLDPSDRAAVVAGPVPVPRGSAAAYAAVALTSRELVVLADPLEADRTGGRLGVDARYVPRARIERIDADGPLLRLGLGATELPLRMGEDLAGRAVRAFAGHLLAGDDGR